MRELQNLFNRNKTWAERVKKEDPDFFTLLSKQQAPEYLWIGCSDSRVSADAIVDLMPGDIFVHRNIANLVIHTDLNCLSVIQYAVEVLKVKHIIVCGHYGCGGVKATMEDARHGLIDNWLCHIHDIKRKYKEFFNKITSEQKKFEHLCELNIIEQVANICETTIVKDAWRKEQKLTVHGWIYRLEDGIIRDLDATVGFNQPHEQIIEEAVKKILVKRD
ncbi:MAG: carbonate dehydratase [Desulfuromonas sp.]|nr:MAG: carbonate dehydratase [Desulfuromonas sp.]